MSIESATKPNESTPSLISVKDLAAALQPEQIRKPHTNIGAACSTVLGYAKRAKAQLPEILKVIPSFDPAHVERLRELASFTLAAYGSPLGQGVEAERGIEFRAASALRELLTNRAEAIGVLGHATPPPIAEIRAIPQSYLQLPRALHALRSFYLANRTALEGRVELPWAEIEGLEALAVRLSEEGCLRTINDGANTNEETLRAYTLMANAYDEIRAAVGYIRRHQKDVDRIIPPFANRKSSGNGEDNRDEPMDALELQDDPDNDGTRSGSPSSPPGPLAHSELPAGATVIALDEPSYRR
ncbi:MAG: hypothetical protein Q8Q09_18655 [Deltaproteobacteria bacterium]|nr:hypothetical protein [Deltaproteobacteria bacterium]